MRFKEATSRSLIVSTCCLLLSNTFSLALPTNEKSLQLAPPSELSERAEDLEERDLLKDIIGIFKHDDVEGYAPFDVACPTGDNANIVRTAGAVGPEEVQWLEGRRRVVNTELTDFLGRMQMQDFDHLAFMRNYTPTVALAQSGGGYRAMLSGAGVISAFDSRTPNSTRPGGLGGLLQGATYLSGLSGGSWLVGSMVINDFMSIPQIQNSQTLWNLQNSIASPKGKPVDYYPSLFAELNDKRDASFDVTLTDLWSVMLARVFVDKPDGGPKTTFSNVSTSPSFTNFQMPFPIFVAVGRAEGQTLISLNSTVYEINPIEFGSHDPNIYAFTKTQLLGSDLEGGRPMPDGRCVKGFDNAGYMMGTSSSLFNSLLLNIDPNEKFFGSSAINDLIIKTLKFLSAREIDIADWSPNPFFGVNNNTNPTANQRNLTLVDGGLDLQNIPLNPLLVKQRKVDVIFANDNSADVVRPDGSTVNWPNGTAMLATYRRSYDSDISNGTAFPSTPDQETFVNLGLNSRPTWFGCNASNFTGDVPPLVVYIPNAPYIFFSNTSTFKLSYDTTERDSMIENGALIATQGDGLFDPEWSACVGCAVVHREMERRNSVTPQCQRCLQRYCWDGTRNSTQPQTYEPIMKMEGVAFPSLGEVAGGLGTVSS